MRMGGGPDNLESCKVIIVRRCLCRPDHCLGHSFVF